jgi:hypothetical protein
MKSSRARILSVLFALLTLAAATPACAARPAGHLAELAQFLDRSTPAPRRQEIFAAWREAALAGDTDAQYVVGTIYRRGDNADPPLVPRDADQARRYLSTAAGHGRLLAMAKMAELELAEDRPFEAMIWTQAYGVYRGWVRNENPTDYGEHNEREPTLYFEDLLGRVTERMRQKLGSVKEPEVLQRLNAFIAAHDKDVRADPWRDGISPRWAGAGVKFKPRSGSRGFAVPLRQMASEWVLVFAADGSLRSAEAFDALPSFVKASSHHSLASLSEMAPAANAASERYALQKIELKKGDWPIGPARTH